MMHAWAGANCAEPLIGTVARLAWDLHMHEMGVVRLVSSRTELQDKGFGSSGPTVAECAHSSHLSNAGEGHIGEWVMQGIG